MTVKGILAIRIWVGCCCLILSALSASGCEGMGNRGGGDSVRDRLTYGNDEKAAEAKADNQVKRSRPKRRAIATVNGKAITQQELVRNLLDSRGLGLLQQMMLREVARQETQRRGIRVEQRDVEAEYDLTVRADRFNGEDTESMTIARREQLIEEWARSRRITRAELDVAMERQAHLRKLAAGHAEITPAMLEDEYHRVHDEKVVVRHIQLPGKRAFSQILQRLSQGERFEDLVVDYSQNALSRAKQGMLPPFSRSDPTVPSLFREVAFRLKVGEVSNLIEAEGSFHVLKLVERIPATGVLIEEAAPELKKNLTARLVAEVMEKLGRQLLLRAELRIEDPVLRGQYLKRRVAGEIEGPPLIGQ